MSFASKIKVFQGFITKMIEKFIKWKNVAGNFVGVSEVSHYGTE